MNLGPLLGDDIFVFITFGIGALGVTFAFFSYWQSKIIKSHLEEREKEINRKVYELAILKELGDRIGYSLNIEQIIDIITGSLRQFIPYDAASYMLLEPEKIIFKVHLEKSVDRKFIDDIGDRMIKSLSAIINKDLSGIRIDEVISGAILVEDVKKPVRSFFNIPVVIGGNVEGVLTIAHTEPGLYREEEMTILYRIMQQASSAVSRLQEVVRNEQRKLNSMVQGITEGVIMADTDYRILVANKASKSMVGLADKADVNMFDFIDKLGGRFDILGRLQESIQLNRVSEVPEVLINDKFYQIFISPVKAKISANTEEVIGGVVVFHDITHDKEIEKLRDDFTSMMVHELRSPLDGMKKRIEVLREEGEKVDKTFQQELTQIIYQNASHMLELVNDLLDAAKLEAGKFQFNKELVDIKGLISDRINFFEILAKDANIKLEANFSESLPEKVNFDSLRIEQVFNNLISNALKFTEPGGSITIFALLHKKDKDIKEELKVLNVPWINDLGPKFGNLPNSLVVAISDTGFGIASENIPDLFNKFKQFRTSAVNKEKKGTGLGLVISKGIVEGHGGIIGISSVEGSGTTALFTLPLV